MEKQTIIVPKGIRYLSEWEEFCLPPGRTIINKQITGCGFTEYCITNPENIILCSPRKILLENKEEQHPEVLYVRNEFEKSLNIDKDLNSLGKASGEIDQKIEIAEAMKKYYENLKTSVYQYFLECFNKGLPCKILVTYDSFRIVKESLGDQINKFYIVIDEMQSVFTDARFKGDTEIEFVSQVQGLQNVCYVSATPMMDEYLEMLDEFKDLPYYELDWRTADHNRVSRPQLEVFGCGSIVSEAIRIIEEYRSGNFVHTVVLEDGELVDKASTEAVFYVNSVKNICDIIKKAKLPISECNILCANTEENRRKLRKAFDIKTRGDKKDVFGRVPLEGEPHKMFTFCTRTVYLGADFCSPSARTFIFSDANIDCLAVDISLDLPQILGRQRLDCNPWRNRAELYFRSLSDTKRVDDMRKTIEIKKENTNRLLNMYLKETDEANKALMVKRYQRDAKFFNYSEDYVAVNTHGGTDLVPAFNNLVMVSELRTYHIQQVDYKDRFSVFSSVQKDNDVFGGEDVEKILKNFDKETKFPDKMRIVCTSGLSSQNQKKLLQQIPIEFSRYFYLLGPEKCKAVSYRRSLLEEKLSPMEPAEKNLDMVAIIYSEFCIGKKYQKSQIKDRLSEIYVEFGYTKTAKANDLEEYFEIKPCLITNKETGKRDHGFEIIKKR